MEGMEVSVPAAQSSILTHDGASAIGSTLNQVKKSNSH